MRYNHTFIAFAFATGLSYCEVAPSVGPAVRSVEAVQQAGVQIAQYPGAPYETSDGMLWFGSVGDGLVRFDGAEFVNFTAEDGLGSNLIRGLLELDDGNLWIATTGGVSVYDGESFTTLTAYGDLEVTYGYTPDGNHRDVWDLMRDRRGVLWIATTDGVFRFDGEAFAPFPLPVTGSAASSEFHPKMVYEIYEDRAGDLWFCTDGAGAVRYDGEDMTVYTEAADGLCSDRICTVLQDRRGDYWFGSSDGGVSRFDGESFTTHFRRDTFSKHSGWGRCMAIHEDTEGRVWFGVASEGGGVHRFDGENFRYFSTDDGLGDGGVPSIRADRSGNLWFGTTSGVFRFDGERFVNVTRPE